MLSVVQTKEELVFFLEGPKILLKLQKLVEWQSHGHGVKSHSGLAFPFSSQLSCR